MIHNTLDCVRPVCMDIWHVERCVCVWPCWLSTSLGTCPLIHPIYFSNYLSLLTFC